MKARAMRLLQAEEELDDMFEEVEEQIKEVVKGSGLKEEDTIGIEVVEEEKPKKKAKKVFGFMRKKAKPASPEKNPEKSAPKPKRSPAVAEKVSEKVEKKSPEPKAVGPQES